MQPLQHEDVIEDIIFPTHGNNVFVLLLEQQIKQTVKLRVFAIL